MRGPGVCCIFVFCSMLLLLCCRIFANKSSVKCSQKIWIIVFKIFCYTLWKHYSLTCCLEKLRLTILAWYIPYHSETSLKVPHSKHVQGMSNSQKRPKKVKKVQNDQFWHGTYLITLRPLWKSPIANMCKGWQMAK